MTEKYSIKWLRVENWRGLSFRLDFNGDRVKVLGGNGTGKSHVADAFFWIMTGVDALDRSNYNLYDENKPFTHEYAIPAVAEVSLVNDGIETVFMRCAKQKWIRPRNKAFYEKAASDEYTFYIDNLMVTANAFKARVEEMFGPVEKLKLMLNIRQYLLLDKDSLRQCFDELIGEVTEADYKGDYSGIADLLKKFKTVGKVRDYLRRALPDKESDQSFERRIDSMVSMLPDQSEIEEARAEVEECRAIIAAIDTELTGLADMNRPYIEKRNAELEAIGAKERELSEMRRRWDEGQRAAVMELMAKLDSIVEKNESIATQNAKNVRRLKVIESQIEGARRNYQYYDSERDRLKAEKEAVVGSVFDENQMCPNCGQPLPPARIDDLRREFNDRREARITEIIERGKRVRQMRDDEEAEIARLEASLSEIDQAPLIDEGQLRADIAEAERGIKPFDDSIYLQEIEDMKATLTEVPKLDTEELLREKTEVTERMTRALSVVSAQSVRNEKIKKIEDEKERRRQVIQETIRIEALLEKCREREREWASIIRARASRHLTRCMVKVLEFSKSGNEVDCFSITVDNVDDSVANTANQLIAGIDIALAFQKKYGLNLPLVIDNAEQICKYNLPEVENQMILLYVDDDESCRYGLRTV